MVKVAYFYPWIFCKGGAERVMVELLKRTRHDFDLFTFCYDRENTFPELSGYKITELAHLRTSGVVTRGARFGLNAIMRKIPNLNSYGVFNVATAGVGELITLRNHSVPTLCFCHTILRPVHEMYDEYKSERFSGLKRIPFMASAMIYRSLERAAWKRMDLVLCNSQNTMRRILDAGLAGKGKLRVLNPGVDTKRFRSGRYERYFLAPGRIQWYKRFELAIEAFNTFSRDMGGFKLKIAGSVSDKDKPVLEFLKKKADGNRNIEFIIGPSDKEMIGLYSNCSAVLFTAKDEDWGIVPLEAMASGKPVISVDEGGPQESVVSGKTGFLVKASAESIAEKMSYLAGDRQALRRIGKQARAHAGSYDWKNFVESYDNYVDEVAKRP